MRHTLTAVFTDRDQARQALDRLLGAGHDGANITLTDMPEPSPAQDSGEPDARRSPGARHAAAAAFPAWSPGAADGGRVTMHTLACPPGKYVLTFATESDAEAQGAVALVSAFAGLNPGADRGRSADEDAGMPHLRYRRHAVREGMQYRLHDHPHGAGAHGMPGGDEAAQAAYRFGHDMHENDRYRNRSWREADGDLKQLWEERMPTGPDWASSALSVRAGWNSTSPEIDGDDYHRSHWRTRYAGSATPAPSRKATNADRPRRAPKADWSRRHPGELPPWEAFMDAVRHGWSRIVIGIDMDEADYRLHHASAYPDTNYDDIAPVYRYGNNARRRSVFRGRDWDDVQDDLRQEWSRGHLEGKPWSWEELEPAMRKGWDHHEA